ncbi:MAG: hypothetical protein Kow0047_03500 [Anaerolineae bacterium]
MCYFRPMTQGAESQLTEVVRVDDHGRVSYKRPDDPIRNYSLLLDLRILIKTIGVVLRGKGAF